MRIVSSVLVLVGLLSASSYGDFTWFNTVSNRVFYNGGSQALAGGASSDIGCFVQLIWAGVDNINNGASSLSETGVSGDDQVQATTWIGRNIYNNPPGRFTGGTFTNDNPGFYYVRFWTAPADNYAQGTFPHSPTNFYGETPLWSNPGTPPPGVPDAFNNMPSGGAIANMQIPEPAVFGLGIIGLISLRLFVRKK